MPETEHIRTRAIYRVVDYESIIPLTKGEGVEGKRF